MADATKESKKDFRSVPFHSRELQLVSQKNGLYGVEGTGEIKKHDTQTILNYVSVIMINDELAPSSVCSAAVQYIETGMVKLSLKHYLN